MSDESKVMESTNAATGVTQGETPSPETTRRRLDGEVSEDLEAAPDGPNGGKRKM